MPARNHGRPWRGYGRNKYAGIPFFGRHKSKAGATPLPEVAERLALLEKCRTITENQKTVQFVGMSNVT